MNSKDLLQKIVTTISLIALIGLITGSCIPPAESAQATKSAFLSIEGDLL